jgi:transposase
MTRPGEATQETISEQMPFSAKEWAQTLTTVQEFVLSLVAHVQGLEAELATLRERASRNSRNSSRPPSSDGPEVPRKPRQPAKSGCKRAGQKGHQSTTRKPVPVEQVKEVHDIKPDVCRRCGHELVGEDPDPYRHQVTEIPPVVAEVTEYRFHTLTCPECGTETRAKLPAGVPQGAFGPRLQAMVSLLSGRYHLSKRDITEVMADFFQADVSLGTVSALEQRTSEAIKSPVDEARQYVREQPVTHLDETGWREANQRAWLWIVVSDRWSAYNWLSTLLRQLCWAHLIRDFQAFVERDGESQRIGEALLARADLIFQWWHEMQEGAMSRATFQNQMQAIQQRVGELLRQGATCHHSKTAGTCRDILKREEAL